MSIATTVALLALITPTAQDTLQLSVLQDAAVRHDARAQQATLQLQAHELRLRNLQSARLPQLQLRGEATQQSDVPVLPFAAPGQAAPEPPRTRYQMMAVAEQLLYDGGLLRSREAAEYARHAELQAELHATLFPLRVAVSEAYFNALLLQVREAEVLLLLNDLDARLAQVRSELGAGAALPGDTAAVQAERLRAHQLLAEIAAGRTAALAVLTSLTGHAIAGDDVLALPNLAADIVRVQAAGGPTALRERPEFARLALLRERLAREADVVAARTRPQLHAFGQAGAGRPGPFQLFNDDLNHFWQVGLRLVWQPWTWGVDARERQLLGVQQQLAGTEEASLVDRLAREVESDAQSMQQLQSALATDEQIIALREQVERQTRRQFEERAVTASQYLSVRNDVFEARVAKQRRRIELERVRARYLTTLGVVHE